MSDEADAHDGRATVQQVFGALGELRSEFSHSLEKFEERLTGRLDAIQNAHSASALKNAHDIGVLETRVSAQEAAIARMGDVVAVVHGTDMRVSTLERNAGQADVERRAERNNKWVMRAAVCSSVTLVVLEAVSRLLPLLGGH